MNAILEIYQYFDQDRLRVILFVLSCIAILFFWKDTQGQRLRRFIVLPALLLLILFLNPIVAPQLGQAAEIAQSLRFFWIIPVTLLISICVVQTIDRLPHKKVLLLLVPAAVGGLLWYSDSFEKLRGQWNGQAENWYKVPNVVVELCDKIMEDDADMEKRAIFPFPLSLWVRQYQPAIQTLYVSSWDNSFTKEQYELFFSFRPEEDAKYHKREYLGTPTYLEDVARQAIEQNYTYIVLPSESDQYEGNLLDYGYEEIDRVNTDNTERYTAYQQEYVLYRMNTDTGEEATG